MIFETLKASNYIYVDTIYNSEFEDVLSKVVKCYQLMISDCFDLDNNENLIRDKLLIHYLKNNDIREKVGLNNYLFDREVAEDIGVGRTDIKIQTMNTFVDTTAYYTLECKRIDSNNLKGITGLNAKYIEKGIFRFISGAYSCHYKINGMIGFVVEKMNIRDNVNSINALLENNYTICNTLEFLKQRDILPEFDCCYTSTHTSSGNKLLIYHLMLDLSENMK
jgi:hypothetical protein